MSPSSLSTPFLVFLFQFYQDLKPGEVMEISGIGYKEWAIYVGDGDLIRLAPMRLGTALGTWRGPQKSHQLMESKFHPRDRAPLWAHGEAHRRAISSWNPNSILGL
nr:uncharacterized protein LOC106841635 [Equus asinus]